MKQHFKIQLYFSNAYSTILDISFEEQNSEIIFDLLYVFGAKFDTQKQIINLDYKIQYNKQFQERLDLFIDKYKDISPQIQQLRNKFKQLDGNEWFIILNGNVELTTQIKYELEKELAEVNNREWLDEEKVNEIFGCIKNNYEIVGFNLEIDRKIEIGEKNKQKRVCRFCGKKQPEVKFKKEAHAISEALGNKKLICLEECDSCNEFFDKYIERDFIVYHDLARIMFGVKNKKNKIPKLKGVNFSFIKDDKQNLNIVVVQDINKDKKEVPQSIKLKIDSEISLQNIYKALVKFALSVVETKYTQYFDKTIKWLKNEFKIERLSKVAVLNSYHFFATKPEITLYIRNNDNKSLPFMVGEFKFTYYVYIFIVPVSNKDEKDFVDKEEYCKFLECFKNIKSIKDFRFEDFSDNNKKKLEYKINFEQRN